MSLLATHFTLIYHPADMVIFVPLQRTQSQRQQSHKLPGTRGHQNIRCWTLDAPQYFGSLLFYHCIFHSENDKYLTCPLGFRNTIKTCLNIAFVRIILFWLSDTSWLCRALTNLKGSEDIILDTLSFLVRRPEWERGPSHCVCLTFTPHLQKKWKYWKKNKSCNTIFSRFHEFYQRFSVHFSFAAAWSLYRHWMLDQGY